MKFQCDRCKTRYSIADERVRGKILKIRCKNCEAVITVREGMEAAPPPKPADAARPAAKLPRPKQPESKPVLRGAFERAMAQTTQEDAGPGGGFDDESTVISEQPPAHIEQEWYTAIDGKQFGPFALAQARDWIAARPGGDEIHCWSEGFDEWQLVDRVSHFRGLRAQRRPAAPLPRPMPAAAPPMPAAAAPPAAIIPQREQTPRPLFAATLEKLEREESNPSLEDLAQEQRAPTNGRSGSTASEPADGDQAFEFDIGEASRVVKLPVLARTLRPSSTGSEASPLPGMSADSGRIGAGTGAMAAMASVGRVTGGNEVMVPMTQAPVVVPPELLQPTRRSHKQAYLLAGIGALAAVVIVMAVIAGGDEGDGGGRLTRSRASADGLGESLDPRTIKIIETKEVPVDRGGRSGRPGGARSGGTATGGSGGTDPFGKSDDFSFGTGTPDADRPLDGDDLMAVYQDNRLAVKLCYERALKKDPLLDVSKIYVSMTVAPTGVVTNVILSSHAETELGTCLIQRMRRWRFRQSPQEFSGRFPLVFRN